MKSPNQNGFTLIELLVAILLIGVLSYLGLTSFWVYRSDAAYSVAQEVMYNSRVTVAAGENADSPPPATSFVQTVQGPITDGNGKLYMPGMELPQEVKLTAQYDPTCVDSSCQSDFLEVRHCLSAEYIQWVRFGDDVETELDNLPGGGC